MLHTTNDLFDLCFRWIRTERWLLGGLMIRLGLGMLGFVSATSVCAVELISINKDGNDSGNSISNWPTISADSPFVAFLSFPKDLVSADTNGMHDVIVRKLQSGTNTLISINKAGTGFGNLDSGFPVISADGRFAAFQSYASDLVDADKNGMGDVFMYDIQSGTTTLISVNSEGTGSANSFSEYPAINADGRFVAFQSYASDLTAKDTNKGVDVFVRDLQNRTTALVSVNKDGTDSGNNISMHPVINAEGRFVAFPSSADNLVAADTNKTGDVFVRDLQSGITNLISVNKDGTDSGNDISIEPVISANGRFVAFTSYADDLVTVDTNGVGDVFIRDLQNGATTLVSIDKEGIDSGNGWSDHPVISADGRFVAFHSSANNLVALDSNDMEDVFVRDLQSGITILISVNKDGTDSGNDTSSDPVISTDGRIVAFDSDANNLVAMDTNSINDMFVRDLQSGTTTLVRVNKEGTDSANNISIIPVASANDRFIAFPSNANNLVDTDINSGMDLFEFEVFEAHQGCNCADPIAIKGTSSQDLIFGTEQADIICGLGGHDFIAGMGGDDCIDGGEGNDWIYGGFGNDTIFGRTGKDIIYGQ